MTAEAPAPALSRDQVRSRRPYQRRSRVVSITRLAKREIEIGRLLFPETDHQRPRTRAECVDGPRPCPFVSCKYHLYLDVHPRTGNIKLNFPDIGVEEMGESCTLDVADRHGATIEEIGAIMNLTRERVRQLEVRACAAASASAELRSLLPGRERHRPDLRPVSGLPPASAQASYPDRVSHRHWQVLGVLGGREMSVAQVWRVLWDGEIYVEQAYVGSLLAQLVRMGLAERTDRGRYRAVQQEERQAAE